MIINNTYNIFTYHIVNIKPNTSPVLMFSATTFTYHIVNIKPKICNICLWK